MNESKENFLNNNTLKNFFTDFASNLNERLRLPVFQYYIIILCFYNWDFILYLIYDNKSILEKINYIKNNFHSHNRYLIPLMLAVVYSVFFPIIQFYIIKIQKNFERKRIGWNQELQTETANHKKNIQDILTGIKEKEDFSKQLDFEKSKNIISQEELELLRSENLLIQKKLNDNVGETNEIKSKYNSLLSSFKYFAKNTDDLNKEMIEEYGEEKYFNFLNILIEIFNTSEIRQDISMKENFPKKLFRFLNDGESSIFSDKKLIDERIKKHISDVLLKNNLIREINTEMFGNMTTRSEEYTDFINFIKSNYSL
ncbi:hypothetical protein [Kaistella sp.]|uniref:hypothetical protein n=1 Tax=Kaistella sp. TaxID=2782235 RepID=UPI003C6A1E3D